MNDLKWADEAPVVDENSYFVHPRIMDETALAFGVQRLSKVVSGASLLLPPTFRCSEGQGCSFKESLLERVV